MHIQNFAHKFLQSLRTVVIDILMPPVCSYCRDFIPERRIFCPTCTMLIVPIVSTKVTITATKTVKVFAISEYKEPLKSLILAKGRSDIVSAAQLGQLMWDMTYIRNVSFDCIVPVPLHWSRFAKRGFNQAHEMAKVISRESGKPVVQLLKRVRRTKYQAGLGQVLRTSNVQSAFDLRGGDLEKFRGKKILLIDDLMTTGSTLKAAAKKLYNVKPASISALVSCRVL